MFGGRPDNSGLLVHLCYQDITRKRKSRSKYPERWHLGGQTARRRPPTKPADLLAIHIQVYTYFYERSPARFHQRYVSSNQPGAKGVSKRPWKSRQKWRPPRVRAQSESRLVDLSFMPALYASLSRTQHWNIRRIKYQIIMLNGTYNIVAGPAKKGFITLYPR